MRGFWWDFAKRLPAISWFAGTNTRIIVVTVVFLSTTATSLGWAIEVNPKGWYVLGILGLLLAGRAFTVMYEQLSRTTRERDEFKVSAAKLQEKLDDNRPKPFGRIDGVHVLADRGPNKNGTFVVMEVHVLNRGRESALHRWRSSVALGTGEMEGVLSADLQFDLCRKTDSPIGRAIVRGRIGASFPVSLNEFNRQGTTVRLECYDVDGQPLRFSMPLVADGRQDQTNERPYDEKRGNDVWIDPVPTDR